MHESDVHFWSRFATGTLACLLLPRLFAHTVKDLSAQTRELQLRESLGRALPW